MKGCIVGTIVGIVVTVILMFFVFAVMYDTGDQKHMEKMVLVYKVFAFGAIMVGYGAFCVVRDALEDDVYLTTEEYIKTYGKYVNGVDGEEYYMRGEDEEIVEDVKVRAPVPDHPVMPHTLLYGGAGQGKTTMVYVTKNEIEERYGHIVEFIQVVPGQIRSKRDLDDIILKVVENPYCILFIDEIHRLRADIEEALYSALQDFRYDITLTNEVDLGGGTVLAINQERGVQTIELPGFTCMGATTLLGDINKPLKDRFTIRVEMDDYSKDELKKMFDVDGNPVSFATYHGQEQVKEILRVHMDSVMYTGKEVEFAADAIDLIVNISWKTARIRKQRSKNCAHYTRSLGQSLVTKDIVRKMMKLFGLDDFGFDRVHRDIIKYLYGRENRPAGMEALAQAVSVTKEDIKEIYSYEMTKAKIMDRDARSMRMLVPEFYKELIKQKGYLDLAIKNYYISIRFFE